MPRSIPATVTQSRSCPIFGTTTSVTSVIAVGPWHPVGVSVPVVSGPVVSGPVVSSPVIVSGPVVSWHPVSQVPVVNPYRESCTDRAINRAVEVSDSVARASGRTVETAVATPVHFLRGAREVVTSGHPAGRHHLSDHLLGEAYDKAPASNCP